MLLAPSRRHTSWVWPRRAALGFGALVSWTLLFVGAPNPAAASCAGTPTIDGDLSRADLVFVGTVTHLTNGDRWATFAVDDVWKGQFDGTEVDVHAGPADPGGGMSAATSVDRKYEAGVRYLVFANDPASHGYAATFGTSRFEDNNCTATQPYSDELDAFRPVTAHRVVAPTPATSPTVSPVPKPSGSVVPWILALAALVLVGIAGGVAYVVLRRRATATHT